MQKRPSSGRRGQLSSRSSPLELHDDRFRLVVEAAPNAIIVTNTTGRIELVNRQAEQLFGYSRSELLGQLVETLIPERFRHHHPSLRTQFMEQPSSRAMGAGRDLYAITKSGLEIPIEIGLNPIHTDDGMLVLSSIIDIRERKAAEQRFRSRLNRSLPPVAINQNFWRICHMSYARHSTVF